MSARGLPGRLNKARKWDPAEVSFHHTRLNNALGTFGNPSKPPGVSARKALRNHQHCEHVSGTHTHTLHCTAPTDAKKLGGEGAHIQVRALESG